MQVVKSLLQKLLERCPVKYAVVRNASLLRKRNIKYEVSGFCWKIIQTKVFNCSWGRWCRSAALWIRWFRILKTQKNSPHSIYLPMLLIFFLTSFSTKTKSTSVFGGSVASLFFLMVKVLSKEVSATISNFYMRICKKNPYLISQQIVYDHINPNEISQKQ